MLEFPAQLIYPAPLLLSASVIAKGSLLDNAPLVLSASVIAKGHLLDNAPLLLSASVIAKGSLLGNAPLLLSASVIAKGSLLGNVPLVLSASVIAKGHLLDNVPLVLGATVTTRTRPVVGWHQIIVSSAQVTNNLPLVLGAINFKRPVTGWFVVEQISAHLTFNQPQFLKTKLHLPRKTPKLTRQNLLLASAIKQIGYFFMPTIVQSFTEVESVSFDFPPSLGEQIVPLFSNNAELLIAKYRVDQRDKMTVNSFIKNFRATSSVVSLPEAPFPQFTDEDTEQDQIQKALEVEWASARIQLNLWDWNQNTSSWVFIASASLLNNAGYPYKVLNLLDLLTDNLAEELGANAKIGVNLQDVGYGRLKAIDKLTFRGAMAHEVVIVSTI